MVIDLITQDSITHNLLFYSRWHSCSTEERGRHYDIKIGGWVGPILSLGNDTFIICTYQTELITLGDDYTTNENGFKIWHVSAGTMYLEDPNGVRFFGCFESLTDLGEEGLKVNGTSCLFTDNLDDAFIESFFIIRDLIPKEGDSSEEGKDYSDVINHVRLVEPIMRDLFPEKFI